MKLRNAIITATLSVLLISALPALAQRVETTTQWIARRGTLAIAYPEGDGTSVAVVGTSLNPRVRGKADVKRSSGRTRVKLQISNLEHPQSLGSYYTTYVVWAVAPEGQADNLGELPVTSGGEREVEVTTPYQTFGLILTAEPYGNVKLPSPAIVAENVLRERTKGGITSSEIQYRGDAGSLYVAADFPPDYNTPLSVLGARRSVEIARRAGARRFAEGEFHDAEIRLAALEQMWPREREHEKRFSGEAHEVMRLAENARALTVERTEQARLDAERRTADRTIARAQSEAERAQSEADQAKGEAQRAKEETANYRDALARSENELAAARDRAAQAQTDAERAKANEEVARIQAERSRLEAEQAKQERDAAQQKLFVSLSEILETRREARGLIVSLSDVLFDFDQASLKPGAKEKLSKLAGILLAYPAKYQMEIEGHTDAVGTDQYNLKLSESRATSVRDYLVQAGLNTERIIAVRGLGKMQPVATNDTAEGRQMNRRVEIIIADTVKSQQ